MKRAIKTTGTIITVAALMIGSYFLGTTQTETITEVQTVTETKEVEKIIEVIPDGYIPLDDSIIDMDSVIGFSATEYGLQLYFDDGSGYYMER